MGTLNTHSYGADPYAMVYGDRVYIYMTHDGYVYDADGNIGSNNYGNLQSKMAIFRRFGELDGPWNIHIGGMWYKLMHIIWLQSYMEEYRWQRYILLYFSTSSIGVLTADSPTGPFTDPLGKP